MLKAILKLVTCGSNKKFGNHSVVIEGDVRYFKYFGNTICTANYKTRKFSLSYCGYENSVSTKRAVNDYRRHFCLRLGYELVSSADEVIENDTAR